MPTEKKTTTPKRSSKKAAEVVETEVTSTPAPAAKLDDTSMIDVQSNVFGSLIFINPRTGDKTTWSEAGDVQTMTLGDLRAMRQTQRGFFENNWIFIRDVLEYGCEDVSPMDVYKMLSVTQYYKNAIEPDQFDSFFNLSNEELDNRLSMMSDAAKTNLIVAANEAIRDGRLDSLRKIHILEEKLGCELVEIQ